MRRVLGALVIFAFGLFFAADAAYAQQDPEYHLTKKVVLGGPGSWDYFEVDSGYTHRVFVPRGVAINVAEADGTVVGTLPTPNGSHGLVFAPEFKRGYTAGKDGQLLIFDPKTLEVIGEEKPPETRSTDSRVPVQGVADRHWIAPTPVVIPAQSSARARGAGITPWSQPARERHKRRLKS